jgi:excisionase family DNA binding protein
MENLASQEDPRDAVGHLLSIKQAAAYLGIGVSTLHALLAKDPSRIPSVRIVGRRLFDPDDLARFIAANKTIDSGAGRSPR